MIQKNLKMTETLADGYSYESAHEELCNEYPHDMVMMVFINLRIFLLWMKVASPLEVLILLITV